MADNPYAGTDQAETWDKGYKYGQDHPDENDPRPPIFVSADGKPVWKEGVQAAHDDAKASAAPAAAAEAAATADPDATPEAANTAEAADTPSSEDIRKAVANASIITSDISAG